ncbi:MAG: hypothetical protein QXY40_02735 [Candidatus Methanomethylicia archaeon]
MKEYRIIKIKVDDTSIENVEGEYLLITVYSRIIGYSFQSLD